MLHRGGDSMKPLMKIGFTITVPDETWDRLNDDQLEALGDRLDDAACDIEEQAIAFVKSRVALYDPQLAEIVTVKTEL